MADEAPPQAQLQAQPQAQAPRRGGGLSRFFSWLVMLGLLAAVWWLASERNARRFTLETHDNTLVVGRGRFFPFGARRLGPEDGELWKLYAPFPLPSGAKPQPGGEYEDQTQLDRALFVDALACARQAAQKGDAASLAQAEALSARTGLLPGLSPAQQDELASLRGELALNAARGDAAGALKLIRAARARLEAARKVGGDRVGQVEALSGALDDAARTLEEAAQGSPRPARPVAAAPPDAPAESAAPSAETPPGAQPKGAGVPAQPGAAPARAPEAGTAKPR
jgi:hypothetical protein